MSNEPAETEVTTGDDPTKTVLSESALHSKELCDYVINPATGCRHGCKFCYVPVSPQIRTRQDMLAEQADVDHYQEDWGEYVLHRDSAEMAAKLDKRLSNKRVWKETPGGRGIVALSFSTDCYQDGKTADATRACIRTLLNHDKDIRILTRNPILALQDLDLYEEAAESNQITIGTSIPTLGDSATALEPRAPHPEHRLAGLEKFSEAGVPTFVSMSPTYPTDTKESLRDLLTTFSERLSTLDVVFHEPINPRGANFDMTCTAAREAGHETLADELEAMSSRSHWSEYAIQQLQWVESLTNSLNIPHKAWPDTSLLKHVEDQPTRRWLKGAYMKRSPETFNQLSFSRRESRRLRRA